MLLKSELKRIATARLQDAELLLTNGRYDGAAYLCGYVLELRLKYRICVTLRWAGFPESNKEFDGLQSFKTHDLNFLLKLSGIYDKVKSSNLGDWSAVSHWKPEWRYTPVGTTTSVGAANMIMATKRLLKIL